VIFQTIFQRSLGVVLSVGQMIGLGCLVCRLGAIAAVLGSPPAEIRQTDLMIP
jgi:hypothetical protein